MIVFTITNSISQQVYVGSTRKDIDSHWETLLIAAESGVEATLYDDIRSSGANNFAITEWGVAEDLSELRELMQDAMDTFDGISLQGLVTKPKASTAHRQSAEERKAALALLEQAEQNNQVKEDLAKPAPADTVEVTDETDLKALARKRDAELEARIVRERQEALEMAKVLAKLDSRKKGKSPKAKPKAATKPVATPASTSPQLASGKVSSAKQEKLIKEKIQQEREERQMEKAAKQRAEAAEMAEIMARIDGRAQAMRKTKPKAKPKSAIRSSRTLSLKKKDAAPLKETRLELERDQKQVADLELLRQEQAELKARLMTEIQSDKKQVQEEAQTPVKAKPVSVKPQISKEQRIASTIDRYRIKAESKPVNNSQGDLNSVLKSRLALRNSASIS